jgi:hypothetical protein
VSSCPALARTAFKSYIRRPWSFAAYEVSLASDGIVRWESRQMRESDTAISAGQEPGAFGSGASAPKLIRFAGPPQPLPHLVNALSTGSRLSTDEGDAVAIVRAFHISVARGDAPSVV